ncbi:MAG: NUDIX hydrolase [Planctomycetales bacterium]|nr:NUDIX hydrolase [Planctomycetales bacterium]
MRKHGPWTIEHSREIYRDPWLSLRLDSVTRPDGQPGTYSTVQLKSGVCVIAIDDQRRVHLTQEFHYAVGRLTLEGVSGGIEPEESAEQAARRELSEELGLSARRWTHLGQIDPFTAAIHSTVDMYLAEELSWGRSAPDGTEEIELVSAPLEEALDWVREGKISHAPTCVALLRIALDGLLP